MGFEVLPHPPYSPDLAPSDYWLFGAMKKPLRGRTYETLQQLATPIYKWRSDALKELFAAGLEKLSLRWAKCVELKGDYIKLNLDSDQD